MKSIRELLRRDMFVVFGDLFSDKTRARIRRVRLKRRGIFNLFG